MHMLCRVRIQLSLLVEGRLDTRERQKSSLGYCPSEILGGERVKVDPTVVFFTYAINF